MKLVRSLAVWALLLAALAPAGAAAAETRTYVNNLGFGPSGGAGTSGPSITYPGAVEVSGVGGTVLKVTVTVVSLSANGDLDMALVGPNGAQVMLMSDACTSKGASRVDWTFDDAAPIFVPQLSCPLGGRNTIRPSNYGNPEEDSFALGGGPTGPFTNALAAFNGISPNGTWKLFMLDDDPTQLVGFEMPAFALNLEVEPPPPPQPVVQTVTVPGPERTVTVTVPGPTPQGPTNAAKTGKRAAALAKCKLKKSKDKRAKCRENARKLPV